MNNKIQKITPNLWFDKQAEEAAKFYISIFRNSKIGRVTRYGKDRHEIHGISEGAVMTVEFQLEGQKFVALNGGPQFKFTEAISFIVNCEDQEELDYYWEKLSEGGDKKAQVCGWLKDKYGVSWQIVPTTLSEMVSDPDSEKSERVMKALLQTKNKIDIKTLLQAYEG
ncbi:VOC family protein [Paenibacillus prosopidis]|uniref:Putative 3-demethylubiquinone-9 3-methyltransferase (Glyoxalase superfamily) n=1 Tax=Paenibacillus prosopidis TaxID=630520 RepID=A0A368VPS2_9BACL|nr:VOC family protein [Paenibacillus prosopidis]RCW43015.1 putative 3-demethylubiquinone-9 3-methyltransferase (glyoxalase superfamily) [Paenibacillus prosopidis]